MEFSTGTQPVARKSHVCDFCGREIKPGEKYQRFVGKYDGEFFDLCHHLLCEEIIYRYCRFIDDQEYDIDSAQEWLEETICAGCEHFDDERDDYSPCHISIYECPKTLERFASKSGAKGENDG